ncbi:hypothetical protein KUTeg_004593 [Tegillarca granosa]|uniref:Uncharacterized protein n=1 Tax=Tegillarca granosa TaxID=220873 RepID=A0ABQ9FS39_TEGGR|nr:hypothetical protein KUTeg_004593 [Tegillarca granosa]
MIDCIVLWNQNVRKTSRQEAAVSADQEPKVNKFFIIRIYCFQQTFLYLMQDLKDEGNSLFKTGHYDVAWMHYRNALFIARILEMRFYHEVDKEFISTLFSNRAFCCLKKVSLDTKNV